jgi:nucleotide-binding universal stress UspA family protein
MRRLVVAAKLKPDTQERAAELVAAGPPFDPEQVGFARHGVYVADDLAIFVFEAADVDQTVRGLMNDPVRTTAFAAWAPLLAEQPRSVPEAYFWERKEQTMKQIVIATDGSPSSEEAVHVGLELASEQGAEVRFVHVLAPTQWELAAQMSSMENLDDVDGDVDRPLREAVALADEAGVPAVRDLRAGFIEDEIISAAEEIDAELIVLGSRGLGAVRGALLGSISRAVLNRAKRPVLVVRGARVADGAPA